MNKIFTPLNISTLIAAIIFIFSCGLSYEKVKADNIQCDSYVYQEDAQAAYDLAQRNNFQGQYKYFKRLNGNPKVDSIACTSLPHRI